MFIKKICKIFKLSNSECIVIPKRIFDRANLNIGDKLDIIYDTENPDTILIKIKR